MDLETLRTQCLSCTRCPLHTTRTNVVFGQGVPTAEVLFVGEGPGQSEDEQGLPFVGRSGQLLDKYLFAIDLDRNQMPPFSIKVPCSLVTEKSARIIRWAAMRPRQTTILGCKMRNCSRSQGIQASLSAGSGSRFWGGRHLTMLAM